MIMNLWTIHFWQKRLDLCEFNMAMDKLPLDFDDFPNSNLHLYHIWWIFPPCLPSIFPSFTPDLPSIFPLIFPAFSPKMSPAPGDRWQPPWSSSAPRRRRDYGGHPAPASCRWGRWPRHWQRMEEVAMKTKEMLENVGKYKEHVGKCRKKVGKCWKV